MKKKIIAIIMAIFTTVSVVSISGCSLLDVIDSELNEILGTDSETSETRPPNSSTGSTSDNSSMSGDSTKQDSLLSVPDNANELYADGLTFISYMGASLSVYGLERPTLALSFNVSEELAQQVAGNNKQELGALLAPLEYFDELNINDYTVIDWVTAFEKSDKQYKAGSIGATAGIHTITLEDVTYRNVGRKFLCMPYIKITNGDSVTYKYAQADEIGTKNGFSYRSYAKSVVYLASEMLNVHAFNGEFLVEEEVLKCRALINEAVDYENGLEEATNDYSFPNVNKNGYKVTLPKGETLTISDILEPSIDLAIECICSDSTVISVNRWTSKITAISVGVESVEFLIAGCLYTYRINVIE